MGPWCKVTAIVRTTLPEAVEPRRQQDGSPGRHRHAGEGLRRLPPLLPPGSQGLPHPARDPPRAGSPGPSGTPHTRAAVETASWRSLRWRRSSGRSDAARMPEAVSCSRSGCGRSPPLPPRGAGGRAGARPTGGGAPRRCWQIPAGVLLAIAAVLASGAPLRVEPAEGAPSPAVQRGRVLYQRHCASCHGRDLEGQPGWKHRLPDGRWPAPPHDGSGHTWHHPDSYLIAVIRQGGQALAPPGFRSGMPAFGRVLSEPEIRSILALIKSRWPERIRKLQPRDLPHPKPPLPAGDPAPPKAGGGGSRAHRALPAVDPPRTPPAP